jgi:hypothetical protein
MVKYMKFYGFWKSLNFHSKSICAYDFPKNIQFGVKPDRNSVFLGRDSYIMDQLSIAAPYTNFMGFEFFKNFAQNPYVLVYGFIKNH